MNPTLPVLGIATTTPSEFASKLRLALRKLRGDRRFPRGMALWQPNQPMADGYLLVADFNTVSDFEANKTIIPTSVMVVIFDSPLFLCGIENVVAIDFDPSDPWSLAAVPFDIARVVKCAQQLGTYSEDTYSSVNVIPIKRLPVVVERVGGNSLTSYLSGFLYQLTAEDRLKVRHVLANCLLGKTSADHFRTTVQLIAEKSDRKINISKVATEEICAFLDENLTAYVKVFGSEKKSPRQKTVAIKAAGISSFEEKYLTRLIEDSRHPHGTPASNY